MNPFEWVEATSVEGALAALAARPGAVLKAGGVDLLDLMKERIAAPARIVNIRNVAGLDRIYWDGGGRGGPDALRIGPLATLARIAADAAIRERCRALADAAGHAATPQIRNMATLGGNLLQRPRCWYFRSEDFHCRKKGGMQCFAQDGENQYHAIFGNEVCAIVHPSALATPLVALGASLLLRRAGSSREVALEEFLTRPEANVQRENALEAGEVLAEVRLPPLGPSTRSAYLKQAEKESFDWPLAEVAVALELEGPAGRCARASIVLGAAAPVPWRAKAAEAALAGKAVDDAAARAAAKAAVAGATPLAKNAYKVRIFETLVRRAILAAAQS
jgi:xanthine dehydrogenase YagS FAD-binding subunit